VVVRETAGGVPSVFRFRDPADALVTGVEYLRRGYWVRLSNATLAALGGGAAAEGMGRVLAAVNWVASGTRP